MKEFLMEQCQQLNIKLVNMNNKYTILSCGINKSGYPIIRVHQQLKNCPIFIDKAILGYYIDFENQDKYLKIIKNYVELQLKIDKYNIKAPNNEYKNYWLSRKKESNPNKPVELNISSIIKKGYNKNTIKLNKNDTISLSKDEMVELDITVDYLT